MAESSETQQLPNPHKKDGDFDVTWELVEPGSERWKQLVANTITDDVLQLATAAAGYTEMANDPNFAAKKDVFIPEADKAAKDTAERLELLRDFLTSPHNQIPTVRKYDNDPNKDLISLNTYRELRQPSKTNQPSKPVK